MKILLIDDNETLAQVYQRILTSPERHAEILTNSLQSIEVIKTSKPDIILLDLLMEPLSGWEVLDRIRDDPEISDIPVIILTGKVMSTDEAIRFGLKIDGYVMKPLERTMLITAVDEIWNIFIECEERYRRAIASGIPEEKAQLCRKMIRKRKMLSYLKELLERQEKILSLRPEEKETLNGSINELRMMITNEFKKLAREEAACP